MVQYSLFLYKFVISSDICPVQVSFLFTPHGCRSSPLPRSTHVFLYYSYLHVSVTGWKKFIQASRPATILHLSLRYFMLQHRPRALTNHHLSCSISTRAPSRENNPPKGVLLDYPPRRQTPGEKQVQTYRRDLCAPITTCFDAWIALTSILQTSLSPLVRLAMSFSLVPMPAPVMPFAIGGYMCVYELPRSALAAYGSWYDWKFDSLKYKKVGVRLIPLLSHPSSFLALPLLPS